MGGKDKALHREFRVEILEFRVEILELLILVFLVILVLLEKFSPLSTLNSQFSPLTKRAFQQSLLELGWHCADLPPLLQLVPN